jgi:nitrogen regulatory protein PII
MKEIKAYIKPHKLVDVTLALRKVKGFTGMTVIDVRGFGHSIDSVSDFIPHIKIEILCRDEVADEIISTIEKSAHTGLSGDGLIYVSDVKSAVRIRTGERDENVV